MITSELTVWAKCKDFKYRTTTIVGASIAYIRARLFGKYPHRVMVCYPDKPELFHSLYSIASELGYTVINDPIGKADIVVNFQDVTVQRHDPVLDELMRTRKVINGQCTDISKNKVEDIFQSIFGYGMRIDPRTHTGVCVRKSDDNARHDGQVIQCPVEPEAGYIYQRLIDTDRGDGIVIDIRVPIFNGRIPFVFPRYKKVSDRFDNSIEGDPVDPSDLFINGEISNIVQVAKSIGLDYGEMDILRDVHDGRIYIVDINNTPGVSHSLVKKLAPFFAEAFGSVALPDGTI